MKRNLVGERQFYGLYKTRGGHVVKMDGRFGLTVPSPDEEVTPSTIVHQVAYNAQGDALAPTQRQYDLMERMPDRDTY